MGKMRGNEYKLHHRKFHLDIRKTFYTVKTIIGWNNLHREVMKFPYLKGSKMWSERVIISSEISTLYPLPWKFGPNELSKPLPFWAIL